MCGGAVAEHFAWEGEQGWIDHGVCWFCGVAQLCGVCGRDVKGRLETEIGSFSGQEILNFLRGAMNGLLCGEWGLGWPGGTMLLTFVV